MSKPYQPVTVEEVLAFRRERFESSMALVAKKGHDYNRKQQHAGDTLFNLRVCELLGIVDTSERGIAVRLSDKFMRIISLALEPGIRPQVDDEPVMVTVDDIHNYVDYLALMHRKRQQAVSQLAEVLDSSLAQMGHIVWCASCGERSVPAAGARCDKCGPDQ